MKKLLILMLAVLTMSSCCKKQPEQIVRSHADWVYDATIYELNTRQFTPEGTFLAAAEQLDNLKELGVDIIWIMPLQPIGEATRKGSLGSYYSIKDYCAFNPEFGTREDFMVFLNKAHSLGMHVILDWVANHTAPDHAWTQNEGWHYRDSLGNLMVQYDWTDISKLNYENEDMRHAMLEQMMWWVDSIGIDGFRCDVAMEVPTDFWEWAFDSIRVNHPELFTLCEAEEVDLTQKAFEMYYGWNLHHLLNEVAQQKKSVSDLWQYFQEADSLYPYDAIRMNFTSNHDENSWSGTEYERMGDAAAEMAAFTYFIPGMPLIYTGQETGNNHRLAFFEKDCIDRVPEAPQYEMYQSLNNLRKENSALLSNELGAPMLPVETDNDKIFAAFRQNDENTVVGFFNFSDTIQTFTAQTSGLAGEYHCDCGMPITLGDEDKITLKPWEYLIYMK